MGRRRLRVWSPARNIRRRRNRTDGRTVSVDMLWLAVICCIVALVTLPAFWSD
jgi:hypothetical protein